MCVTGGSGYIGSWIVKRLLERGYTVHATVRNSGHILNFLSPDSFSLRLLICVEKGWFCWVCGWVQVMRVKWGSSRVFLMQRAGWCYLKQICTIPMILRKQFKGANMFFMWPLHCTTTPTALRSEASLVNLVKFQFCFLLSVQSCLMQEQLLHSLGYSLLV